MSLTFQSIVRGQTARHPVLESAKYLAFLEPSPLTEGHTVVIPKKVTDHFFDLQDAELAGLILFAKKTARAIQKAVPCKKIGVAVYGLKVRHAHIHLVPLHGKKGELDLSKKRKTAPDARLKRTAEKIRKFI